MTVGVFDSGIGGLTVLESLLEHKLFKEIVYFGDTARVPYGVKDQNTIIRYSLEALEFFENFKIDILIIACNTVSAYALNALRAQTNIVIIGVIQAGILSLEKKVKNKDANILTIGTKATINSMRYENELKERGYKNLTSLSTGLFVPIVEENLQNSAILTKTIEHYFHKINNNIDAIILGCTHFPLIEKQISSYLSPSIVIHSGDAIVELIKHNCKYDTNIYKTKVTFYASENPNGLKKIASKWLGKLL